MTKKKTEVKDMEAKQETEKKSGKKMYEFDVVEKTISTHRVEAWSAGHAAELFNEGKAEPVGTKQILASKVKRARLVG